MLQKEEEEVGKNNMSRATANFPKQFRLSHKHKETRASWEFSVLSLSAPHFVYFTMKVALYISKM